MALLQQTASYLMTFVAQYYGAKRLEMIGPAVWQSMYISVVGGFFDVAAHPARAAAICLDRPLTDGTDFGK